MRFTVEKNTFTEALSNVQNVISSRNTLQILSNAIFSAKDGLLTIAAINLEIGISIRCSIAAKVDEPGTTTLPAKRILGIVRELGDSAIEFSVDSNDTAMIQSGASFFRIAGLPAQDFPEIQEPEGEVSFSLPASLFKEMLRKTSYAVSEDESRRILTGILLSFKDDRLTTVATDGRRLALVEHEMQFPPEIETDIVLPFKTAAELMRNLKDDGDVKIFVQSGQAIFRHGDTVLSSKLIDGTFPNYRQVIPSSYEERAEIVREEMLSALKRVSGISSLDKSLPIVLGFSGSELEISMQNPEVGEAKETIAIKYPGKDLSYNFNPEYLMAPLRNMDSDVVFLELSGGHGPATFKCDSSFLYVIMPLRIS